MNNDVENVLVIGGSGFIGSNFIEIVSKSWPKIHITNIDKLGIGSNEKLDVVPPSYKFLKHDISQSDVPWERIFKDRDYQYIFNFAAESHVDRSITNPTDFIRNNVVSVANLFEAIATYSPNSKVVQISTDEVYGHLTSLNDAPFTVDDPLNPRSPYASSKASGDLIAGSFRATYGINLAITRCCNNFGKNQFEEKLIPKIIRKIWTGGIIPVYGNGQNIREWIHVDDHVDGILAASRYIYPNDTEWSSKYIHNIGTGVEKTNLELILQISKIMGKNPKIEFVEDRKAHDFRYAIENSIHHNGKIWNFDEKLEDVIKHYIDSFSKG